jgi:hypothetical protein
MIGSEFQAAVLKEVREFLEKCIRHFPDLEHKFWKLPFNHDDNLKVIKSHLEAKLQGSEK